MLLFCAKTIVRITQFELACLKKKVTFWFGTFVMLVRATMHFVGCEVLENELYLVLKAYKFTILYYHILRVRAIPAYRVYQLCNGVSAQWLQRRTGNNAG